MATNPSKPSSSPPWFMLSIIGVVLVGFLAVAYFASQGSSEASATSDIPVGTDIAVTSAVTVEGEGLSTMPQGGTTDEAIGTTAPTLIGTDFNDNEVRIEADGRPKVVYFLAHWCSHCNAEVPQIVELLEEGSKPDELDIYAVSTYVQEGQANYPPNNWLNFKDWTLPVMRDSETLEGLVAFGSGGFPYAVYLAGDGTVLNRTAGELGKDGILTTWNATVAASEAVAEGSDVTADLNEESEDAAEDTE